MLFNDPFFYLIFLVILLLAVFSIYDQRKEHEKRKNLFLVCENRIRSLEAVDPTEYAELCPEDRCYLDTLRDRIQEQKFKDI